MIFTTTELKIRKVALNTILTATHPNLGTIDHQFDVMKAWEKSAARIIIHTNEVPKISILGGRIYPTKTGITSLSDMIRMYVVQIPGAEVFAIAAPNTKIAPDQKAFFEHVEYQKMERSWAAHSGLDADGLPRAFIMSAPVLPHILRDLPEGLTLGNNSWSKWLHEWLRKFMLQHRYFDATKFNITPTETVVIPEIAPLPPIESVLSQKLTEPETSAVQPKIEAKIKRKPGRPKKVKVEEAIDF